MDIEFPRQFGRHRPGASRAWVLVVLLALGWAQLAIAAHQFDHPASGIDDACRQCAQLERHGDAPAVVAILERLQPPVAVASADAPSGLADRRPLPARQRDPPLS